RAGASGGETGGAGEWGTLWTGGGGGRVGGRLREGRRGRRPRRGRRARRCCSGCGCGPRSVSLFTSRFGSSLTTPIGPAPRQRSSVSRILVRRCARAGTV